MPRIWKDLLTPGTYRLSDERVVTYTKNDTKNMEAQGNKMLQSRLRVPVILDHDEQAVPAYMGQDRPRTRLARDCVGDCIKFRRDERGVLQGLLDLDDYAVPKIKRVKTVSPRLDAYWTDEKGRTWEGLTVSHVAFTPKPIQRDQQPINLSHVPGKIGTHPKHDVHYLAHQEGSGMADENEEKKDEGGEGDGCPEGFKELVEALRSKHNIPNEVKSIGDLVIAIKSNSDTPEMPSEPEEEDLDELEEDDDMANNTQAADSMPPVMMSHVEKQRWDVLAKADARNLGKEIVDLFKNGQIDRAQAEKLRTKLKAASLSHKDYDKNGRLKKLPVVIEINFAKTNAKGKFANKAGDLGHGEYEEGQSPKELTGDKAGGVKEAADDFTKLAARYSKR